ncbi:hypothetical protein BISA_1364 [Bifidobacterium saguini DSM 23967]|uniref:Uncharacterized protein n=2 Tax=Bifidobacterium saguini TaxID=762210 RepID=A0A087DCE9_9BIFI|nr:hypothetical protein BISA_1364 [Bifidobacterium saguini DSM 23967]
MMGPVTAAHPITVNGRTVRFTVDQWVRRHLKPGMFEGMRRHLMNQRGIAWHNDPNRGGIRNGIERWTMLAGRHPNGGTGVTLETPDGTRLDISLELDGAIPPEGRFWENPAHEYPILEAERARIIHPVEPAIENNGPYGAISRLMEFNEPYLTIIEQETLTNQKRNNRTQPPRTPPTNTRYRTGEE